MGEVFRYVADEALEDCGSGECQHCQSNDKPIYSYLGTIKDPKLAANLDFALKNPDVYELCADCIQGGNVENGEVDKVAETIKRSARDSEYSWREVHKIPSVPSFVQGFDWPMCCGEWCEFLGNPASMTELFSIQEISQLWDVWSDGFARDFKECGKPESFLDVSKFVCHCCRKNYYIDQYT